MEALLDGGMGMHNAMGGAHEGLWSGLEHTDALGSGCLVHVMNPIFHGRTEPCDVPCPLMACADGRVESRHQAVCGEGARDRQTYSQGGQACRSITLLSLSLLPILLPLP